MNYLAYPLPLDYNRVLRWEIFAAYFQNNKAAFLASKIFLAWNISPESRPVFVNDIQLRELIF